MATVPRVARLDQPGSAVLGDGGGEGSRSAAAGLGWAAAATATAEEGSGSAAAGLGWAASLAVTAKATAAAVRASGGGGLGIDGVAGGGRRRPRAGWATHDLQSIKMERFFSGNLFFDETLRAYVG